MSDEKRDVVIASAARSPIGAFGGALATVSAPRLGAAVIAAALERAGIPGDAVDEVIMGCVLPAAQGQAPARQAAMYAGLPQKVECMTINKVCGSGLKAVMLAAQAIRLGDAEVVVAGGMESMSQVPYYLPGGRWGLRMQNAELLDGMIHDGLWDPYGDAHMGTFAERCRLEFDVSREAQDAVAIESTKRAQAAQAEGRFVDEIVPIEVPKRKGDPVVVSSDEGIGRARPEKIPQLRPAFDPEGTVTAGNASSINDGAAALVVMSREKADALGVTPLATLVAQASFAQEPAWFTTAPVGAVKKVLERAELSADDIDLWEINEAFAVVSLVAARELGIDMAQVNVNGGAVVLGHPIGASGARILTTLLYAMRAREVRRGVATLCIGGGEASAVVVER